MKREEDSPRKEQRMKTTFLHLQTFLSVKQALIHSAHGCPLLVAEAISAVVFPPTRIYNICTEQMCCKLNYGY